MIKRAIFYSFFFMFGSAVFLPAEVVFLAHFNKGVDADYSITGKTKAEVKDISLTRDKKGYPFTDSIPSPECADVGYSREVPAGSGLYYDSSSIDVRQGTIQMWVKANWDWDSTQDERNNKIDKSRNFLRIKLKGNVFNSINLMFHCNQGGHCFPLLFFYIYDGKNDYICDLRVGHDSLSDFKWQKDTWHYIVATWTPTTMVLYADGKKVGERTFETPMDCPWPEGPLIIGNSTAEGKPAGALIDEVRILDHSLSEKEACEVPTMELSETIHGAGIAAGGPATFFRPEARSYYAYQISQPPAIDGDLSDKCWENIPLATGFVALGIESPLVKRQTMVKAAYDQANLYVAVFCQEDNLKGMKTEAKDKDPGVFGDDAVEVFISPEKDGRPFVQFGINLNNAVCPFFYDKNGQRSFWEGKIVSAARKAENGWGVELAIPLAELKITPEIGKLLRWNVGRDRRVSGLEYASLNFVSGSFLEPVEFGELVLSGEPKLSAAEEETRINKDYLERSRKEMQNFLAVVEKERAFTREVDRKQKEASGLAALEDRIASAASDLKNFLSQPTPALKTWNNYYAQLVKNQELLDEFTSRSLAVATTVSEESIQMFLKKPAGIYYEGKNIFLSSAYLLAVIDGKTGAISGLWEKKTGRKLILSEYDIYYAESRTNTWRTDQRLNKVTSVKKAKDSVTLVSENPDLPGLVFEKRYSFTETGGEDRIFCSNTGIRGRMKETTLLKVSSATVFEEQFRTASFYDRLFVIGTMGNPNQQIWAKDIKEPIMQRAWFNADEGRAQFSALDPKTETGLGQYLYKVNGRWIYPQGLAQSYWNPFGWEMGCVGEFFKKEVEKKITFEVRYHLFHGDRLVFHREYMNLPERLAVMKDWAANPETLKIIYPHVAALDSSLTSGKQQNEYVTKTLLRPDEICIGLTGPGENRWGMYPASDTESIEVIDPITGKSQRTIPCPTVKGWFAGIHKAFPGLKLGFYRFIGDIYKGSSIYREHPEWMMKDKNGREIPEGAGFGRFYAPVNCHPAYMEYLLANLLKSVDYFDEDVVYLDFPTGFWVVDWDREEVVTIHLFEDWLKKLHTELGKRKKFLWLNSFVDQYYYDIGFHEGDECRLPWRQNANIWLMRKLYTRKGNAAIPLYWKAGDQFVADGSANEERYRNLVLACGLKATGCYLDPYQKHFPDGKGGTDGMALNQYTYSVHAATRELLPSEFVDIGLEPAWWRDFQTEYEAYTLKQGNSYLVNIISHYKDTRTGTFTLKPESMNFQKGKTVLCWQFYARNQKDFFKTAPQPAGWEKMFKEYKLQTFVSDESMLKLSLDNLEPGTVRMTALTQVPAFIYAVSGKKTQLLLSDNLGSSITGDINEQARVLNLTVEANQPITVIAHWPFEITPAVELTEKGTLSWSWETIGKTSFVKFDVEKGNWKVKISGK